MRKLKEFFQVLWDFLTQTRRLREALEIAYESSRKAQEQLIEERARRESAERERDKWAERCFEDAHALEDWLALKFGRAPIHSPTRPLSEEAPPSPPPFRRHARDLAQEEAAKILGEERSFQEALRAKIASMANGETP